MNSGIGRVEKISKYLIGNLAESRGYPLLYVYPFLFGGFSEHSLIQIIGLSINFKEFQNS